MNRLLLIFLLCFSSLAFGQGLKTSDEARELSDSIMTKLAAKEFEQGLSLAKQHWPLPEVEIDGLANQIKTQWPIVDQRFGKYTGHEFIKTEKIGTSFIRYYYLHKFQNHAIYWTFTFYRPNDKWLVNGITFLDSLEVLYQAD